MAISQSISARSVNHGAGLPTTVTRKTPLFQRTEGQSSAGQEPEAAPPIVGPSCDDQSMGPSEGLAVADPCSHKKTIQSAKVVVKAEPSELHLKPSSKATSYPTIEPPIPTTSPHDETELEQIKRCPTLDVHSEAVKQSLLALASTTVNVSEGKKEWDLKRYAVLSSICNLPDEKSPLRIQLHESMDEMLRNFQQKTRASWMLYIPAMLHALGATEAEIATACPHATIKGKSKAVDFKELVSLPAKGILCYFKEHYESMDTRKKQLIMVERAANLAKSGNLAETSKAAAEFLKIAKSAKQAKSGKSADKSKKTKAVMKKTKTCAKKTKACRSGK